MLKHSALLTAGTVLFCVFQGVQAAGRILQASTPTPSPSGIYYDDSKDYMLLGCFPDAEDRTMSDISGPNGSGHNSADMCAPLARASNYTVFAMQSSSWCNGATNIPRVLTRYRGTKQDANQCAGTRCCDPKAADVTCGGPFANTVYVWKGKEGYTNLGCYAFKGNQHAGSTDLTGTSAAKMSPAECHRLSPAHDFFALVDGNRCIGFRSLRDAAVAAAPAGACSAPCLGAGGAKCGGKEAMQLYARNKPLPQLAPVTVGPDGYVYLGCVANVHYYPQTVDPSLPALETQLLHGPIPVDTTYCASAAKRAGKRFFGTQTSSYCMGGTSLVRALKFTSQPAACNADCAPSDKPGRKCGSEWGNFATSLYVLKSGKDFTNLGCYATRPDRPPLPQLLLDSPKMTPGFCYRRAAAYKYFALFNGTRCYAANSLSSSLRNGRGSTGCTISCSGNKQTCGGPAAFMVYVNHDPTPPAVVPKATRGLKAAPEAGVEMVPLPVPLLPTPDLPQATQQA